MKNILYGSWIGATLQSMDEAPMFFRAFDSAPVRRATLYITALGVYEAFLNGKRVGDFVMAPGWTCYEKRLQVQQYDVTALIHGRNELCVGLGKGWYGSRLGWLGQQAAGRPGALLATLRLEGTDGAVRDIVTDSTWTWGPSPVRFCDLYDGERIDNREQMPERKTVVLPILPKDNLIPQEGEEVCEQETLAPIALLTTPQGDRVLDFGQNITGYVSFGVRGPEGHCVQLDHAEILDKAGNFYTENLRTAKAAFTCILKEGENRFKPHYTFYGFRYVRLKNWPCPIDPDDFRAIVVHSNMRRTGSFACGSDLVNRLYSNIVWGQKGNYLDIPTDCPQRDERLGWTGDAQVFIRTAAYNYDVQRFFSKWLHDLKTHQHGDGAVPGIIPDVAREAAVEEQSLISAAWGDAACVCPWQLYLSYGDGTILAEQYDSMKGWVEYMRSHGSQEPLWDDGVHYGDWLGLDAPYGSYRGSTDESLIACASLANCTDLLIKAGKVLRRDTAEYEALYGRIVSAFRDTYMVGDEMICKTQTAHVLALQFHLCPNPQPVADALAAMIRENGGHLTTGFVGTPYLLHVLSDNGYGELAYDLLLREQYPSWLFSVRQGATTVWEHWDGMKEDGTMWPVEMNSFNHYAYGAVGDWLYAVAAGIQPAEDAPGYRRVNICPLPDKRLGHLSVGLDTRQGKIESSWRYEGDRVRYRFTIPEGVTARVVTEGKVRILEGGTYHF